MDLGNKRGHIDGDAVGGTHTTTIEGADAVLKRLSDQPWFRGVSTTPITLNNGGRVSVSVKRSPDPRQANTLLVTFVRPGNAQTFQLLVHDLEASLPQVLADLGEAAEKKLGRAPMYDHTQRGRNEQQKPTRKRHGEDLLQKWDKAGRGGNAR